MQPDRRPRPRLLFGAVIFMIAALSFLLAHCGPQIPPPTEKPSAPRTVPPESAPTAAVHLNDLRPPPPLPPPPVGARRVENYVAGPAMSVSLEEIVVAAFERGEVLLRLSPSTQAWDGLWVKDIPIDPGDWIAAWGERQADGSHDVEKLYVNIVNLQGIISNVEDGGDVIWFRHQDARQGAHEVKVDLRMVRIHRELQEGGRMQVIGRKLKDGSVVATTLL